MKNFKDTVFSVQSFISNIELCKDLNISRQLLSQSALFLIVIYMGLNDASAQLNSTSSQTISTNQTYTGASTISNSSIVTISGGTTTFNGTFTAGNSTAGTLIVKSGATVIVNGTVAIGTSSNGAIVVENGGRLIVNPGNSNGTTAININSSATTALDVQSGGSLIVNRATPNTNVGLGLVIGNSSKATIAGSMQIRGGGLSMNGTSKLTYSGVGNDTIIGDPNASGAYFSNNTVLTVGAGVNLYIKGDVKNDSNAEFVINGNVSVNGNYQSGNTTSNITGSGTVTTTGSLNSDGNQGSVFGQRYSCASGPCAGNNLISSSNTNTCNGGAVAITGVAYAGATYQWLISTTNASSGFTAISGATSQDYSTTGSSSVQYTYYKRQYTLGGQTYNSNTLTITSSFWMSAPTVAPITGPGSVCVGATITLASTTSGGTWSSAATGIATVNTSGVVTGTGGGTVVIRYTVTSGSCSGSSTKSITVVGTNVASISSSGSYTVPAGAKSVLIQTWGAGGSGSKGYTNLKGTGGGGGGFAQKTMNITGGSVLSVTVGTGAVGAAASGNGSAGGTTSVSFGSVVASATGGAGGISTITPSGTGGAGGIFSIGDFGYSGGSGATIQQPNDASPGGGAGSSAGTASNGNNAGNTSTGSGSSGGTAVTGGAAGGSGGTANSNGDAGGFPGGGGGGSAGTGIGGNGGNGRVIITAYFTSITYSGSSFCKSVTSAIPIIDGVTGGTFASTAGLTINASTGEINPGTSTIGNYTVSYSNSCGVISSTFVKVLATPAIATTTPASRCGSGAAAMTLSATASAGTINWYTVSTGGTSVATGTSYSPTVSVTTTYYVDATNNSCTTPTRTAITATVTAIPTVASTTPASRCGTGTITLGATASAGTINWYTVSTGGTSVATGPSYSTTISETTTYYVDATNNSCTTSSRTAVVATVNSCTITWTGATSTDWNTNTNWSSSSVPTTIDDVIIPASVTSNRMPVISAGSDVRSVSNSGTITMTSSGILNVYGNISSTGTFTTVSGSAVAFNGNTAQTVNGVSALHNVKMNNTGGGVSLSSALTVNGTLSLTRGVLTTNSKLTINFDNGGNIAYTGSELGSISGTVSGRRDLIKRTHYIAAPFSGSTSEQVQATTPLYQNTYWRMFTKDFAAQNWTAVTTVTAPMPLGTGFSLTLAAPAPLILSGTYNHTATFTGPDYSNAAAGKYLLVGNPYPSTLDWNNAGGWTKTNVGGAIYFWDPANSRVASYVGGLGTNGGTQYIPAMQSFLVTTTGTGGSSRVSINNAARSAQSTSYFRIAEDEVVRVRLTSRTDSTRSDETVIRFNELATNAFDYDLDALKIFNTGGMPSVYTTSPEDSYSVNSYTSIDSAKYIPVATKLVLDGSYTLQVSGSNPNVEYILVDKLLGTSQSIDKDSSYAFTGLKSDDVNRFELQLRVSEIAIPTGVHSSNKSAGLSIYSSTKGFVIKTGRYAGDEAEIEILDMTGNSVEVLSGMSLSSGSTYVPLDLADGAYLVKVRVDGTVFAAMIALVK
jgi:hypothetical protein